MIFYYLFLGRPQVSSSQSLLLSCPMLSNREKSIKLYNFVDRDVRDRSVMRLVNGKGELKLLLHMFVMLTQI